MLRRATAYRGELSGLTTDGHGRTRADRERASAVSGFLVGPGGSGCVRGQPPARAPPPQTAQGACCAHQERGPPKGLPSPRPHPPEGHCGPARYGTTNQRRWPFTEITVHQGSAPPPRSSSLQPQLLIPREPRDRLGQLSITRSRAPPPPLRRIRREAGWCGASNRSTRFRSRGRGSRRARCAKRGGWWGGGDSCFESPNHRDRSHSLRPISTHANLSVIIFAGIYAFERTTPSARNRFDDYVKRFSAETKIGHQHDPWQPYA
jgi:hypothetical protein